MQRTHYDMLNAETIWVHLPLHSFNLCSKRRCCCCCYSNMIISSQNTNTNYRVHRHRTLAIHFSSSNYVYCLLFQQCYFLCVAVPLTRVLLIFYLLINSNCMPTTIHLKTDKKYNSAVATGILNLWSLFAFFCTSCFLSITFTFFLFYSLSFQFFDSQCCCCCCCLFFFF